MEIKIVGAGCQNCIKLADLCQEVISETGLHATVVKITDINQFADLGIFKTPGLIVDGKILSQGKIPVKSTLSHWLQDELKG
ncbi:MAG: TM0996/MTH895 family glutaredoxin-like protein [Ignavibacteriaceae bacterium]|nr:TM0996/MTH895 family glutaredoxin-like protein [Ignavibacteriaceae bacterium]